MLDQLTSMILWISELMTKFKLKCSNFLLRVIIFSVRNFWEKETRRSLSLNIQPFYSSQFCPLLSLKLEFNELKQNWSTEPTRGFSTCTPWEQDSQAKAIVCQGLLLKLCAFPLIFSSHFLSLLFLFPLPSFYIATFFSATKPFITLLKK